MDLKELEIEKEKLRLAKKKWIEQRIDMGGSEDVIKFIADVLFHGSPGVSTDDSVETIRCLFEAGYCYHFAKILEDAFPNGQICYCYNFGHIVYVYEGVAYDINGMSDAEHELYIPLDKMEDAVNDFKHVGGLKSSFTKSKVDSLALQCKREHADVLAISAHEYAVVDRSRGICKQPVDPEYSEFRMNYLDEKARLSEDLKNGYISEEQFNMSLSEYCRSIGLDYSLIKRFESEFAGSTDKMSVF